MPSEAPWYQEYIGWISSFILVATLGRQVVKQWKENTSKGVSKWLFLGELGASTGFVIYSWMVQNWVFVVTNVLIFITNVAGLLIVLRHRRIEREGLERSGTRG